MESRGETERIIGKMANVRETLRDNNSMLANLSFKILINSSNSRESERKVKVFSSNLSIAQLI